MQNYLTFTLALIVLLNYSNVVSAQIVKIAQGLVQGTSLTSREGAAFSAFLGLPYAKAPIGDFRFRAPEPHEGWDGIRNATEYGSVCSQHPVDPNQNYAGNEDCLTINVFTKNIPDKGAEPNLHPVLVYIHGGFFMVLSGSNFGPLYFMDHDVVIVTFNYRLAALGFLSTEDDNAPGNFGMKDQVLALRWVKDNIHFFGGDPDKIAIYGESAGSAGVHYHLLSPMSRGLFSAAIGGSGTAFKVYSYQVSPLKTAETLASRVGCQDTIGNNTKMVQCLREVDVVDIASTGDEYLKPLKDLSKMFSPSSEPNKTSVLSEEPFLTIHPYLALVNGDQQTVPWLTGINSGEGLLNSLLIVDDKELIENVNENWTNHLAAELLFYDPNNFPSLSKAINEFYLKTATEDGRVNYMSDLRGFSNIFTDRYYFHASLEAVKLQAKKSPVFLYYNDYNTATSPFPEIGVTHGEEVPLLYSPPDFNAPIIDNNHPDYEQSKILVNLWMQFINDPYNMKYDGKFWTPVNPFDKHITCLTFRNSERGEQGISNIPESVIQRIEFWSIQRMPPYQEFE